MLSIKTQPKYLKEYIKFFYSIKGNVSECPDIVRRLPDGTLDIVFNLGSSVIQSRDGIHFEKGHQIAVTGLYQDKNFIHYTKDIHIVGVVFKPGYAHLFVKDSLEYFQQCSFSGELIYGNSINELHDKLHSLSSEKEKHFLLESYLLKRLQNNHDQFNTNKILQSVQLIHFAKGQVEIPVLSKAVCMSERNFRRKFTELVGMSPKQFAGIIRIKTFSKLFEAGKTYLDCLSTAGYFDQSHFIKDFQKISGTNPTNYFNQLNKMTKQYINLI